MTPTLLGVIALGGFLAWVETRLAPAGLPESGQSCETESFWGLGPHPRGSAGRST